MNDATKPAGYRDALRAAYIAGTIALADLLLLADYLIAIAVQTDGLENPAQLLVTISLSVILPAALSFAAMAAGYAWTYTIWPHDD